MPSINLYKIEDKQCQNFLDKLSTSEFEMCGSLNIVRENYQFFCSLYFHQNDSQKSISWNWVLETFGQSRVNTVQSPKAIILIEVDKEESREKYALTFGTAFFTADKFCDREFAFDFATRLHFNSVKTTTLTSPNSNRNRMVNTYIDSNEITFDSGESFAKLKATISDNTDPPLFKPTIEIGNSIKFATVNDDLDSIVDILIFIFNTMKRDKINNIPLFKPVKDEEKLLLLESLLNDELLRKNDIKEGIATIELEIIGASEVFNSLDDDVQFKFGSNKPVKCRNLSLDSFKKYCESNQITKIDDIKNVNITRFRNDEPVVTRKIKECIDFTVDTLHSILYGGDWYEYNADYLEYLNDSTNEIQNVYSPQYDFNDTEHTAFLESIYTENFPNSDESQYENNMKTLNKKYYSEYCFNCLREKDGLFKNFDRVGTSNGFEMMDLYEEESCTMFAVKMGNSSAKLCYAIDQSLVALKKLKEDKTPFPTIKQVGLWLIFSVKRKYKMKNEQEVDLASIDMLMLKNRLDQWKKEVLLAGLTPVLYINYRSKD